MGGAQRGENKRRQQAAGSRAVAKARGGAKDNRKVIAAVIGVVVLAAVVIGGVLWTNASKNETKGHAITPQSTSQVKPEYSGTRDGVVVNSGNPQAKATIDIYADFLCPMCGKFQQVYGKQIEEKINSGALQVRYHMVPMLAQGSNPPGYSLESANAALAAADAGKFTQFHDSLFAQQPPEGGRGYDKTQLIQLGKDFGINDEKFADAVNNGTYEQQLNTEFAKTSKQPWFQGTPTVLQDGKPVEWKQADWLNKVTAAP